MAYAYDRIKMSYFNYKLSEETLPSSQANFFVWLNMPRHGSHFGKQCLVKEAQFVSLCRPYSNHEYWIHLFQWAFIFCFMHICENFSYCWLFKLNLILGLRYLLSLFGLKWKFSRIAIYCFLEEIRIHILY